MQPRPIRQQLFLVKFRPGLYQAPLTPREFAGDQFDGIEAEDRHIVLVLGVEVRQVVRCPDLHVHTNNDTKKAAEFWHIVIPSPKRTSAYLAIRADNPESSRISLECPRFSLRSKD